jgi:predicted MFS family arabinose efflux permease
MLLPRLPSRHAATVHDLVALLRVPRAIIGLAATALLAGGHFTAYTYLEPFLTQVARMQPGGVSWTLAAYGIAGVLGTFAGERACSRDVRSAFLVVALSMAVAVILAATLGSNAGLAALFVVLWGIAFGAMPVCVQIWLYEAAPERFESGSAAMVTVFQLALSAGAFGGGLIVDQGGLLAAFYLGGVLSALCTLLVFVASCRGRAVPA